MERQELINKVKTRIDEVSSEGELIVDVGIENTKPYDSIIDELLDESALEVLLKAPFYRLAVSKAENLVCTPVANDKSIGKISVPNDFIRLVSFKMSDWQQSVTSLAQPGDELARKQSNKYIRGGIAKPVGVLKNTPDGLVIEYYSVKQSDTHSLEEFYYIKKDTAENITDAQMIDAMVWICAGKTLGVLNQVNLQNVCFENAKGLLV